MALTGGTQTIDGDYTVIKFTSSGSLISDQNINAAILVVAGGGGGGFNTNGGSGGGGGGGLVYNASKGLTAQTYTVTVGNGGASHTNGEDSIFDDITAVGGGRGGNYNAENGGNGGSGGGAAGGYPTVAGTGGSPTASQGYAGGNGYVSDNPIGGGGGGAGEVGDYWGNGNCLGGDGLSYNISGVATYYAGGGGATLWGAGGRAGGLGGGGTSRIGQAGDAGGVNTGGGGGAGGTAGGAGGSGIVILRVLTADITMGVAPNTPSITSPTASQTGVSQNPSPTGSSFSDDDVGDAHSASQWQIATDSGFSSVVWDSGTDTTHLTSTTVNTSNGTFSGALSGATKLAGGTNYYIRVRYRDTIGSYWSNYSSGVLFTTNVGPSTPSITTPASSATNVARNPTLIGSTYSDAEADAHASSQWQIATDSGFNSVVWDSGTTTTNKTSVVVNSTNGTFSGALNGKTKLEPGTAYYVRVRYRDTNDNWSSYYAGHSFTTIVAVLTQYKSLVLNFFGVPVNLQKAGSIDISEGVPSGSPITPSIRYDTENNKLYVWTGSAWKSVSLT